MLDKNSGYLVKLKHKKIPVLLKYCITYLNEIIGMQVLDESEQSIGAVTEVIVTGANDVYVIRSESGEEVLIPAIKSVILKMDREANLMIIRLQEWL